MSNSKMTRVSARPLVGTWPIEDRAVIRQAQNNYDKGHSELVQRREGEEFVLYEIVRKVPCEPRNYFR